MPIDTLTEQWGERRLVQKLASMLPTEGMIEKAFFQICPSQVTIRQMIEDNSLVVSDGNVRLNPLLKKQTPAPEWKEMEDNAFALREKISDLSIDEYEKRLDLDRYPTSDDRGLLLDSLSSIVEVIKGYNGDDFTEDAEDYMRRMRDTVILTEKDVSLGKDILERMKKVASALEKDDRRTYYERFYASGGEQMVKTLQNFLELPGASAALRMTFYFDLLLFFIELERPTAKLEACKRYLRAASECDVDSFELSFVHRNAIWCYEEIYETSISIAEYRSLLMKWTKKKEFAY